MALNYYHTIQIENRAENIAPHTLRESTWGTGAPPAVILRGFVHAPADAKFFYARTGASGVSTYRNLAKGRLDTETSYSGGGLTLPVNDAPIESFITAAGALDGLTIVLVILRCRCYKYQAGPARTRFIRIRGYHRDVGGTETLLDSTTITAGDYPWQNYDRTLTFTQAFATNERFVVKYTSNWAVL